MIITRPEYDVSTRYLSAWSKEIIKEAKRKNIEVIDLHAEKASKKEFEGRVAKKDPDLVVLNGYGNTYCVTGHDEEVLVRAGHNSELLRNRINYAVSCSSASVLGNEVASFPYTTYIGYTDDFVFPLSQKCIRKPLQDERAGRCLKISNHVVLSLLKGHSSSEAVERSKRMAQEAINNLLTSTRDAEATFDARILWWNLRNQVCLGDGEKKVF